MPLINNVNELNSRIEFYKKERIKNENGDYKETLVKKGECWCKVKSQLLKEYQANVGTILEDTVTFIIREFQTFDIDHEMAVKFKNDNYEIIKSMPDATDKEFKVIIARIKK